MDPPYVADVAQRITELLSWHRRAHRPGRRWTVNRAHPARPAGRRPKALIIGAGIGGLAAAGTLRRVGVDVELYERAGELRPAGSALSLTANARVALRTLGIDLDVERRGRVYPALQLRTATGRPIRTLPFAHLGDRLGAQNVAIHRAELHQALLATAGDPPVRLGATAQRFEVTGDRVRVEFHDGRTAEGTCSSAPTDSTRPCAGRSPDPSNPANPGTSAGSRPSRSGTRPSGTATPPTTGGGASGSAWCSSTATGSTGGAR